MALVLLVFGRLYHKVSAVGSGEQIISAVVVCVAAMAGRLRRAF